MEEDRGDGGDREPVLLTVMSGRDGAGTGTNTTQEVVSVWVIHCCHQSPFTPVEKDQLRGASIVLNDVQLQVKMKGSKRDKAARALVEGNNV